MSEHHIVCLPQVGANDEYAMLVEWNKDSGEHVKKGSVICTVETSKAVYDVEADIDGFLVPLAEEGEDVKVGSALAVLSSVEEDVESVRTWLQNEEEAKKNLIKTGEVGHTKKALILARRFGIDISEVQPKNGNKITESDVTEFNNSGGKTSAKSQKPDVDDFVDDVYMENGAKRLLIVGGGYGCVQLQDAIRHVPNQRVVGILDDDTSTHGKSIIGVPVLGNVSLEKALDLYKSKKFDEVAISVSTSIPFREKIFTEWTKAGIPFANIIHPSAVIGSNVSIGQGNIILAFCHIGACTKIGDNNFLSPYIDIEHHSFLGSHCSFGPGVLTSSSVDIADRVKFGTGVFIEPFIKIGSDSIISSGAIIVNHIPENSILKAKPNYVIKKRKK